MNYGENQIYDIQPIQSAGSGSLTPALSQSIGPELFQSWLSYLDAKPKTIQTYTRSIKQFMLWLASKGIARPDREDIRRFRDEMAIGHKPNTVQAYMAALKQFFNWTEEAGIYPNVSKGVQLIEKVDGSEHLHGYLTSKQAKRLLDSVDRSTTKGKRDYAMLALMMTTGLRTISISLALVEDLGAVGDCAALFYQGKGHSQKDTFVKLSDPVEAAIRDYLASRGRVSGSDPLFASTANRNQGQAMSTRAISGVCKARMKAAGYDSEKLTAHSLRHTAATLNLRAGGTVEETQQLLNHKNISTTMIYSHVIDREKSQSEQRISGLIFGC